MMVMYMNFFRYLPSSMFCSLCNELNHYLGNTTVVLESGVVPAVRTRLDAWYSQKGKFESLREFVVHKESLSTTSITLVIHMAIMLNPRYYHVLDRANDIYLNAESAIIEYMSDNPYSDIIDNVSDECSRYTVTEHEFFILSLKNIISYGMDDSLYAENDDLNRDNFPTSYLNIINMIS